MNDVITSLPLFAPHLHRLSPTRSSAYRSASHTGRQNTDASGHAVSSPSPNTMSARKRKAEDDTDERMSASPQSSPSMPSRALPQSPAAHRTPKRMRTNMTGHPLALPRLLETLGPEDMRGLLRSICERHPEIGAEVVSTAPRPSVASALGVLGNYESALRASFPFGGKSSSDYSYNRVRQALVELLDALKDYTPHFLPPNETQTATSLGYLDGATDVIHRLPNWDSYQHNRHKQEAYEEIAKAWALVIRETAKRAGGMQLLYGGWDQKLAKHNEISGGKMQEAVDELRANLGWMGGEAGVPGSGAAPDNTASIRQQLLNGTYGSPVRVGPW